MTQANLSDRRCHRILTLVFLAYFVFLFSPWRGGGSDEIYYYGHLSSLLFDGDVDLMNDCYLANNTYSEIRHMLNLIGPKGLVSSQFAIGSSILWLPFCAIVRLVGWCLNLVSASAPAWTDDRFSIPYLLAVSLASLAYGFLLLNIVYATCRIQYSARASLYAALGAVFASPVTLYIYDAGAMAHTPSAFSVALLFYLSLRHRAFPTRHSYILIGAALGLATLVRWQNVVFGLIPGALWLEHMRQRDARYELKRQVTSVLAGIAVFVAIVSLQLYYWYAQTGTFFTVPQGRGFMQWSAASIGSVLFSGWHGLYYWHPLLLLGSIGLLIYLVKNRGSLLPYGVIASIALMVYVNAAVTDWFGGAAFGGRRFSGCIPLFAFGLACFYSLFRTRLTCAPAVITIVAMAGNLLLYIAFTRAMFDEFFFHEVWMLCWELIRLLPKWLVTIPLKSYSWVCILLTGNYLGALVVWAVGFLLVGGLVLLTRRKVLGVVEKRAMVFIVPFLVVIVLFDLVLFLRAPAVDRNGILFSRMIARRVPGRQKKKTIHQLMDSGYRNPALYFYAVDGLGEDCSLREYLDAVYEISPHVWAKWVLALPDDETSEGLRQEAKEAERPRLASAYHFYVEKIDYFRKKGDAREERRWLRRFLRYDPFNPIFLARLIVVHEIRGRHWQAAELESRLRRYLETKVNNYFRIEGKVAPWHLYLFEGKYLSCAMRLVQLYENSSEFDRAMDLYEKIEDRVPGHTLAWQRKAILKAELDGSELDEESLLRLLEEPDAPVGVFVDAAKLYIGREQLGQALEVLKRGMKSYPNEAGLGYWLRQTLNAYAVDELPLDDLLATDLESPQYWLAVAEHLIRAERFEDARRIMERSIEQIPDHPRAHFLSGSALFHLGRFREAEPFLRRALTLSPDHPTYGLFLGRCLLEQGRLDEAWQVIDAALERNPSDRRLQFWKKELELRKG